MSLPRVALKEWASVVRALETGVQDVILRRGGIAEPGDVFTPEHQEFLLFPTYFHQQAQGIRPEHRALLDDALAREPAAGRVRLTSLVRVRSARPVSSEAELDALASRHIYTRDVVLDRLRGHYGQALYVMEVAVECLQPALELPLIGAYGGCKSWLELELGDG